LLKSQTATCLLMVHSHSNRLLYCALPEPAGQSPVLMLGRSRDCISCIALHPSLSLAVVGCLDGMVYAWVVAEKCSPELPAS
jgi:hypothetical protein